MYGYPDARLTPTPTELRAQTRHTEFHRKIAERAAALTRGPPAPAREFYDECWFMITGVSPCATLTMKQIKLAVCYHFGIDIKIMVTGRRAKSEVIPRQLAMFLCKELTTQSLPQIGRNFGGSDHTTVLHACRRIPIYCEKPEFKVVVDKIRAGLESLL